MCVFILVPCVCSFISQSHLVCVCFCVFGHMYIYVCVWGLYICVLGLRLISVIVLGQSSALFTESGSLRQTQSTLIGLVLLASLLWGSCLYLPRLELQRGIYYIHLLGGFLMRVWQEL